MKEHIVDTHSQSTGPLESPARLAGIMGQRPNALGGTASVQQSSSNARAIIGGVDYAVGGWGKYEIDRRRARWELTNDRASDPEAERPGAQYKGRTYIHADDAVQSVMASRVKRGPSVLQRAALRLADALGDLEARHCSPDWECEHLTIPPLTSADLHAFAADPSQESDLEALQELSTSVLATAAMVGTSLPALEPLPPVALPTRTVAVTNDKAILRLEAAVAAHVARLETLQAALASQLEAAATAITQACGAPHRLGGAKNLTRGEEIDAAAKSPPHALLKAGLPWQSGGRAFDLSRREGAEVAVPTEPLDGIYFGLADHNDPARATLLTPHLAAVAAFKTSGRMYAWFVLDSPEGCYAMRAPPRDGYVVRLDPDAIVAWLKPRLTGNPPHKIAAADYLAHLRSLGLEILVNTREGSQQSKSEMRFNLGAATTAAERARELTALRALTQADFAALDWTEYNHSAASEACRTSYEVAGDVIIDLTARTVAAPKVRPGTVWGARTHRRSYITFHTHPMARFRGGLAEPPSTCDVLNTLEGCALDIQAWAFVSTPEGTYILRPSQATSAAFLHDPQETTRIVSGIYTTQVNACAGTTAACSKDAIRALEEAGFIAHLQGEPCILLMSTPDLFPLWNQESRKESRAAYAALANTSAEILLATDWEPAAAEGESPSLKASTWITASLKEGRVIPSGNGHNFNGPPDRPDSYPSGIPGPLFVIYFPEEDDFPGRVPFAALNAARKNAALWAWVVFLSPSRVTIFRAGAADVEIHGPTLRQGAEANRPHGRLP